MNGKPLPSKLKHDAIIEALLEIRFKTNVVPEIIYGRLTDSSVLKGVTQRMPAADIPEVIRRTDPQLRYQPTIELRDSEAPRAMRIGPEVLSFHRTAPYVGWTKFQPELFGIVKELFSRVEGLSATRLGLRYINALSQEKHGIGGIRDLDMQLAVDKVPLSAKANLNFTIDLPDNSACTVRVASRDFVAGQLPEGSSVVVDVDVFTKEPIEIGDVRSVQKWIDLAHTEEKRAFFSLLTLKTINDLKEE